MKFLVFHRKEPTFGVVSCEGEAYLDIDQFTLVAKVELPGEDHQALLGAVFELTNHIDSAWNAPGASPFVTPFPERARSTSVGDYVVCLDEDKVFRVEGCGWSIAPKKASEWLVQVANSKPLPNHWMPPSELPSGETTPTEDTDIVDLIGIGSPMAPPPEIPKKKYRILSNGV